MNDYTLVSIAIYFICMLSIGLYAYLKTKNNAEGYLLGGRQLTPAVTALSAGASDMSGWILMGLPGALFISGMSGIWIAIGLLIGAYLNYLLVAPKLRSMTEAADNAITIPDFLDKRFVGNGRTLRIIAGVVIIIFFTLYSSSGLVAGGKLFASALDQSFTTGVIITAVVVVLYTLFGGFLAVSLTDFVQGCIMFVALILVPYTTWDVISQQGPITIPETILDPFNGVTTLGIISAMAWGLGYFGQPHILVRFMAIRTTSDLKPARRIGMSWMLVSVVGAVLTGLFGAIYAQQHTLTISDPETIFIVLSEVLFHPLITGFLLAAILAAIMSTISSQLLVSASSLSEDIYQAVFNSSASEKQRVLISRICVFAVAFIAALLAQSPDSSILNLVGNAWAGFGAAFGPTIIMALFWSRYTIKGATASMLAGTITVLIWIYLPVNGVTLSSYLYEIIPGIIAATITGLIVSHLDHNKVKDEEHFRILEAKTQ